MNSPAKSMTDIGRIAKSATLQDLCRKAWTPVTYMNYTGSDIYDGTGNDIYKLYSQ